MSDELNTPAAKLAALNERLKGAALLTLLNIKSKPAPEVLNQQVADLRQVVLGLCEHLPADDPNRATALERLKSVDALVQDPLEWHVLTRALEMKQDASDPAIRALIEGAFYEEHVPRAVWSSAPQEGAQNDLRRSLRIPLNFDVELDVGGKRLKTQTQNLSRDGCCLEVPAGFSASTALLALHLASTNANINVAGDVVWREQGRVGLSFKIGVPEQNALDAALLAHFASLQKTVERWRIVSPKSTAALACSCLVGYAASALPSMRKEHFDRLAAAALADPTAKELQLALAKLTIEERDYTTTTTVLKRVVRADRDDPRFHILERTLAQRTGSGRGLFAGLGARLDFSIGRAAGTGVALAATVAAIAFLVLQLSSAPPSLPLPAGGFACQSLTLYGGNQAFCRLDLATYRAMTPAEQKRHADNMLQSLRSRGVTQLTIAGPGENDSGLDSYPPFP